METRDVHGTGDRIFQIVCHIIMIVLSICAIAPFIMLIASSLTADDALSMNGYNFWPSVFSLDSYAYLFKTNLDSIVRAYGITIFVTVVGTGISLAIAPMFAYVLSRRDYKKAKVLTFLVVFTMLFNGGTVPSYMMWVNFFHLKNTVWALILPNLVINGFSIILYKSNFRSNIHPALLEAARIDGAGEFYIYRKVVLPLSKPILATVGLMTGLAYWNDWTNGLYYLTDKNMYSLQVLLNSIMNNISALQRSGIIVAGMEFPGVGIRMAIAVIGFLPILLLYPFFQKYFISGISLGGVKE